MHVIGTAGHVDHGKSALIAALTGTNPDRLAEERERGMTLDLGFAHLRFDDGVEAGIVDVPGHERFLHNMLAGAAGMEVLLLVVDVNEGVMPQTLEHLAIVQFLNVTRVLIAANKVDLIDAHQREERLVQIRRQLAGTLAADAPMLAVSAMTRENLDNLREALHDVLRALPARDVNAPAYLPIDRVFTLRGLGTVVTGTLMQGRITAGETLALAPGGAAVHVRSIGVFGSTRQSVDAGSRVALNLPGTDRRRIVRGDAVVGRELTARSSFAVRFVPLEEARGILRRRTPVRAYLGSAEILGTLVTQEAASTGELHGELHLREPVVAFPGLRFVLRRPSPMTLLGGGFIERTEVATSSEQRSPAEDAVFAVLHDKGINAAELHVIAAETNLREGAARAALAALIDRGDAILLSRPTAYVEAAAADDLLGKISAQLEDSHCREPWAMGMTLIALARCLSVPERTLVPIALYFVEAGRLVNRAGYYALPGHHPSLTDEQRAFFDLLVQADEAQPMLPFPFATAASAVKRSHVVGLSKAFDTLLARGAFVKVGDDLYRGSQINHIRDRVEAHFREHDGMTAAEFRDMLGTSRKYAVPLLEWFDSHGLTIRDGDYRRLRRSTHTVSATVSHTVAREGVHSPA